MTAFRLLLAIVFAFSLFQAIQVYIQNKNIEEFEEAQSQRVFKPDISKPQLTKRTSIQAESGITKEHPKVVVKEDQAMRECIKHGRRPYGSDLREIISLYCLNLPIKDASLIQKMPNLEKLEIIGSEIQSIDVHLNPKLNYLNLSKNNLEKIDISKNIELKYLDLSSNEILYVDLSNNSKIRYLLLFKNKLEKINLESLKDLFYLYINDNYLAEIHIPNSYKLTKLYLYNNQLQEIKNLENVPNLDTFEVFNNKLTVLDLTQNKKLQFLTMHKNPIVELHVHEEFELNEAWAWNTSLSQSSLNKLRGSTKSIRIKGPEIIDIEKLRAVEPRDKVEIPTKYRSRHFIYNDCQNKKVNEFKLYLKSKFVFMPGVIQEVESGIDLNPENCNTPLDIIYPFDFRGKDGEIAAYLYKSGARTKWLRNKKFGFGVPFIQYAVNDPELFLKLANDGVNFKRQYKRKTPFDYSLEYADDYSVRLLFDLNGHHKFNPKSLNLLVGYEIPYTFNRPSLYYFFRSTGQLAMFSERNGRLIDNLFASAVHLNNKEYMDELLMLGANVNYAWWQEIGEIRLIESVVQSRDLTMTQRLVELGATIPGKSLYWLPWDPKFRKERRGIVSYFNAVLKTRDVDRNNINKAFLYAILDEDYQRVDELLIHEEIADNKYILNEALSSAATIDNLSLVQKILSSDDIDISDEHFSEPLAMAIANENIAMIKTLLEKGTPVLIPQELGHGDQGSSILEIAINHKNSNILGAFISFNSQWQAAKLISAIHKDKYEEAIEWLQIYDGKGLSLDLSDLGNALSQAVNKDNTLLAQEILSFPEGKELLNKKRFGLAVVHSARSKDMLILLIKNGGGFTKINQSFVNRLNNSIHSEQYEYASLIIENMPSEGYERGMFRRQLQLAKKQGAAELYDALSQKIDEIKKQ